MSYERLGCIDAFFVNSAWVKLRAWGSVVVKALRYKSEVPGIDFQYRRGFFHGT
jgi:hypothetical protein